ncbi:MAG: alpha/beta hydrolase, partial [Methanosarcinales archaeon]|nr:alpha/beta hydrolase [Methanosarcinales archaeon]
KQMYEMVSNDALELITMNIADYDYMDTICRHDIPMMLIWGGKDKEINKNLGPVLEILEQNPSFELVDMPNAGHFANMEKPSDFNEILKRFLLKQSIRNYL